MLHIIQCMMKCIECYIMCMAQNKKKGAVIMQYVVDFAKCPALYNLLTLNDVLACNEQIIVHSADIDDYINVSKLIDEAFIELKNCAID